MTGGTGTGTVLTIGVLRASPRAAATFCSVVTDVVAEVGGREATVAIVGVSDVGDELSARG